MKSLSSTISEGGDPAASAFAVSYTSLMLIILSMIVGAFGAPAHKPVPNAPLVELGSVRREPVRSQVAELALSDLFVAPSKVHLDQAEALFAILMSHNVDLEVSITAREGIAGAVSRASALARFFEERGIAFTSVKIWARDGNTEHAHIRVFAMEGV